MTSATAESSRSRFACASRFRRLRANSHAANAPPGTCERTRQRSYERPQEVHFLRVAPRVEPTPYRVEAGPARYVTVCQRRRVALCGSFSAWFAFARECTPEEQKWPWIWAPSSRRSMSMTETSIRKPADGPRRAAAVASAFGNHGGECHRHCHVGTFRLHRRSDGGVRRHGQVQETLVLCGPGRFCHRHTRCLGAGVRGPDGVLTVGYSEHHRTTHGELDPGADGPWRWLSVTSNAIAGGNAETFGASAWCSPDRGCGQAHHGELEPARRGYPGRVWLADERHPAGGCVHRRLP